MAAPLILSVPDMSCGHCRASIQTALASVDPAPAFDMHARRVTLVTETPEAEVLAALAAIGFDATPVAG